MDFRSNLKKYFDMAFSGEPIIIPRKENRNDKTTFRFREVIQLFLGLFLGLFLTNNLFAFDLNKASQVFDKSMDIAIAELDSLKDFDIPRAEDVEAKVNNEMYIF